MAKQWFFVRQTSGPDRLCLFGPFATRDQAADYGAWHEEKFTDGDPRWQTIELDLPNVAKSFSIPIEAPTLDGLKASRGFYSMPYGDRVDALKAEAS